MSRDTVYKESLPSPFISLILGIMVLLAALFLFLFGRQVLSGPIGRNPAPDWYYMLMFLVFAGTTVLLLNLQRLDIRIDAGGVLVRFGAFRQEYAWEDIVSAGPDQASVVRYGGWGIRFTRAEGFWRRGYTVINAPRVVLTLRQGRFRQFAFSTNRPDAVLEAIREYLRG